MVAIASIAMMSCSKDVDIQIPNTVIKRPNNLVKPLVLSFQNYSTLDSGIIAKFLFRNNLVDSTIYRNDGTMKNGNFSIDRFNQDNECFYSNNGFMESNNIPFNISKNYTITFWVKMMGFTEGNSLMELNKNRRYDGNPIVWMSKDTIYLSQCNKSKNRIVIKDIPSMLNKWVNVTWVLHDGITILYVDGKTVGVSNFVYPDYSDITLTLGNAGNIGSPLHNQPSDAYLDDVKIYNRVLTESEIIEISKN
jgi:Concanavalin A-like lectin/glucanases superfamily